MMSGDHLDQSIAGTVLAARSLAALLFLSAALPVCAQQLAARHYDISDGLAHSYVGAIHQDRKGYLWFGTREGLSRFDGYRFTNYSERDGLGHMIINDIAEDREGRLWVGTNGGGVARLIDDPQESGVRSQGSGVRGKERKTTDHEQRTTDHEQRTKPKFINFRVGDARGANYVNALLFDAHNNLWCATDAGLYRAAAAQLLSTSGEGLGVRFEPVAPHRQVAVSMPAFADRHGRLWFGIEDELIEVVQGQIIKYGPNDGVGRHTIMSIVEDQQGRLLVANEREIFEFIAPPSGQSRGWWRLFPFTLAPDQRVRAMAVDATGTLWVGTVNGLIKYRDGKKTLYTDTQGLSSSMITALTEDRDGNLWIGTSGGGVCKLSGELIVSFTRIEGLPGQNVYGLTEDRRGRVYASVAGGGLVEIVEGRAIPVPGSQARPFSALVLPFQDSHGDWWIKTAEGLFRFTGPELQLRRGRKLSANDGILVKADESPLVTEDPFGHLWVARSEGLYRLDLARKGRAGFERIPVNVPLEGVLTLMSDHRGALWMGGHDVLARWVNGKTTVLQPAEGLPEVNTRALFRDSRGWVWVGLRYKGVSMTKEPGAEIPHFVNYSTHTGLSSDTVWSITEDDAGRIYLSTGKGLDQLDPMTGRNRHFSTKDGLASDSVGHILTDRNGNIWIATTQGLSKLNPRAERKADHPPPIYLSRVQTAGEEIPLPETGAQQISELELPAARNNLLIEYVALSFQGEQRLRYQYKLEGVDEDWSPPTEGRSVNYARLAPGTYQFLARAINQEGAASPEPASLRFRILPPLWQRWWFLMLAALSLGVIGYAGYRYRVARLLELERVRMRIATDLHDDIGSSLSHMAILSEVVKRQIGVSHPSAAQTLTDIAGMGRELVDAMSDIVWAIDPRRDDLRDLVSRIRRFASDSLDAAGIAWVFETPAELDKIKLTPEQRRHLYLIFKEAIHNIVRHADCTSTEFSIRLVNHRLVAEIRDDGRGFASPDARTPSVEHHGHGLRSMQARATELGGQLQIDSAPGHGTRLILTAPIK